MSLEGYFKRVKLQISSLAFVVSLCDKYQNPVDVQAQINIEKE